MTELRKSLAQQTATSEVLADDLALAGRAETGVLNAMLENATQICQAANSAGAVRVDAEGAAMRVVAMHNAPPAYA